MIIATAGHIDHGKTTLVKLLSGVDTDSLPEEKARGISIDLGFAYWNPPGAGTVGFVDVPGHERFVRNMVAGVCGIDYVMLTIAADDGVMPQTIEHLNIVDMLGIGQGVAVISKIDRVEANQVDAVRSQVRALLAGSALADIAIIPVSAQTGVGVDTLRDHLAHAARTHLNRKIAGRNFRYAIDRAFSVPGSGTVVTGTVFDGTITVGDRVTLSPAGITVRVRTLQKVGSSARHANAGERCGLNLPGVGLEQVRRGNWLLAPVVHAPTQRVDARLTVLATEDAALRHWTPVHLHIGTAELLARVAIKRGASIAPGETARVQLILEQPAAMLHGDRFIIRNQAAQRTVGGGVVLDPFAPQRRVHREQRAAQLDALQHPIPHDAAAALLAASPGGLDMVWLQRVFNLTSDHLNVLLRELDLVVVGREQPIALPRASLDTIGCGVVERLQQTYDDDPQLLGVNVAVLREHCAPALSEAAFTAVLKLVAHEKKIELIGAFVALRKQQAAIDKADEMIWQKLKPALEAAGFKSLPLEELATAINVKGALLDGVVYRRMRHGDVFQVAPRRFYLRTTLAELALLAQEVAGQSPEQRFTAAQYRDRVGVNRKLAIQILETLDRLGITRRVGDEREIRQRFAPVLGVQLTEPVPG